MRLKSFSAILFALAGIAILGLIASPSPAAVPVTRTIEILRPALESPSSSLKASSLPRNFGPGGAKRVLGVVTLVTPSAQNSGTRPRLDALSSARVIVNPPGCGTPVVAVVNDSFYVTWPAECAGPGARVVVQFASASEISSFLSGQWRDGSNVTVATASGTNWTGVPGIDSRMLSVLLAFLAIAGMVTLRRRGARSRSRMT